VFPLQTGVVGRVLLLGYIFLLACVWVASCFLAKWFGRVVFVSFDGLWVYSLWLHLRNAMMMFAAFLREFRPRCLALVLAEPWCCRGVVAMRSGGGAVWWRWWWWGFSKRGGWCCLGEEVGAFVAFVMGDSFWRLPLLFGSIFVVAKVFRVFLRVGVL